MTERWERPCATCGAVFLGSDKNCYCAECARVRARRNRAKRVAEGRQKPGVVMPREYHREYAKTYNLRPDVKARRAERAKRRYHDPIERIKYQARRKTRSALEAGVLTRLPCEVCGVTPADAHHDDYDKPLEVRWLCRVHHTEHHAKATGAQ